MIHTPLSVKKNTKPLYPCFPDFSLFRSGPEAPWYRPDIFDLAVIDCSLKGMPEEETHTTYVREMLLLFNKSSLTRCEGAIHYVLAAVAYANMDSNLTAHTSKIPSHNFPNKKIENGLKAAYHF